MANSRQKRPATKKGATTAAPGRFARALAAKPYLCVLAVYLAFTLIRTLLIYATILYPKVLIDEMLYSNLARAIANGEGLLFKGQSADYNFLLYPLVLSPVYALFPAEASFYKIIQCYNTALMSLSVFPIFALAKAVTKDEKKAFLISVISLLMPDFLLSGFVLSESVVYPLFFAVFYLAYRYIEDNKGGHMLLIGVLGGLLYEAKPGHVVPAAVMILYCLLLLFKRKQKQFALDALLGLLGLGAVVGGFTLLTRFAFHQQASMLSIYDSQIAYNGALSAETLSAQTESLFKGIALSPYYFFIACGGLCALLPLSLYARYDARQRALCLITLVSLAFMILGTAWIINRPEYMAFSIHTRYYAMYIPLMLTLSLIDGELPDKQKAKSLPRKRWDRETVILLGVVLYIAVCSVVFGCAAGISSKQSFIFTLALSAIRTLNDFGCVMVSILIAVCALLLFVLLKKCDIKKLQNGAVGILLLGLLINNAASLTEEYQTTIVDSTYYAKQALADNPFVTVVRSGTGLDYTLLDTNSKRTSMTITINDLFNILSVNKGVYRPYVPEKYRGMSSVNETPDVEYLAIDAASMEYVKLSDAARILTQKEHSAAVSVVRFPRGERIADSVMGGVVDYELPRTATGYIRVFDAKDSAVQLQLKIGMDAPGTLNVACGNQRETLSLDAGQRIYTVDLQSGSRSLISFSSDDSTVRIYGYDFVEP